MCGGSWIIGDSSGAALFHARDAFTPVTNRMAAEMRCVVDNSEPEISQY